ncbi:MAG: hypothetical protein AMXMBFR82_23610 [Candidatus Hydrogenedentota bacterium]
MKLLITNMILNTRQEIDLEERNYIIGRDVDNDIVLDNFFVSQRQAILKFERDLVAIRPVGSAPTKVNDQVIPNHKTYTIQRNDEIGIGQYVLKVMVEDARALHDKVDDASADGLRDLEKGIHDELLQRLDLRKIDPKTLPKGEYRKMVEVQVKEIIDEKCDSISPDIVEYVCRTNLKEAVAAVHMQDAAADATFDFFERLGVPQLRRLVAQVYANAKMDLMNGGRSSLHTEDLEVWVDTHYADFRYELMKGLKSQLLRALLKRNLMDTVFGFGPLEPLLHLPNISEIMVVHPRLIYVEKNGVLQKTGRQFISDSVAMAVVERIVAPLGLRVDRSKPLVDARLPDGSRVNVIIPPLALRGPCITIRRFSKIPLSVDSLIHEKRAFNQQVAEFLKACVAARKNIIISGGTGAGKTTLLNCLSEYISARERIVTIEDSAELQLRQEHVVSLESRPANVEGKGAYTIRDLVKNALRMRPDRVIVGECRGAEALDMLQAMNTGHDGSMTTGHANTPADMMRRLETMVLLAADMPIRAIREQIASAIDLVIQYTRFGDGTRKVTKIAEIVGIDPESGEIVVEDIFSYSYTEGRSEGLLCHTGYVPSFFNELMRKGGVSLDVLFSAGQESK